MRININWGWRIVILYTGFVGGMSYLVYRCTSENIDLVATNYYERELQYDVRYDKVRNAQALEGTLDLSLRNGMLTIAYPAPAGERVTGTLMFYKPDDATLDFSLDIETASHIQEVNTDALARGLWKVQADWTAGGISYFHEQKLKLD